MLSLSAENILHLRLQAERLYPSECCGFLVTSSPSAQQGPFEVWPMTNAQNQYHASDPENFPRTSREAYFMAPEELIAAEKKMRGQNKSLTAIYHSHIDAGAYFSKEDEKAALMGGKPAYPGVFYIVISVEKQRARSMRVFSWSDNTQRYEDSGQEFLPSDGPLPIE